MIVSLPSPEIQAAEAARKALEPRNRLLFIWDKFFAARKYKLTEAEVAELRQAEQTAAPWRDAAGKIWKMSRTDDEHLWTIISELKNQPTDQNFAALVTACSLSPGAKMQLQKAAYEMEAVIAEKLKAAVVPLVRRHLEKIHRSLCLEYEQQAAADLKALARLNGVIEGGESEACIQLRNRAAEVQNLLDNGDLVGWRQALAPFLP